MAIIKQKGVFKMASLMYAIIYLLNPDFWLLRSTKDFVRRIHLFMQNKAKFKKVKFNVTNEMARNYEQKDTWSIGKKQSQTKPNKPKSKKDKMNVSKDMIEDYEKMSNWAVYKNKANSKPILSRPILWPSRISMPNKLGSL